MIQLVVGQNGILWIHYYVTTFLTLCVMSAIYAPFCQRIVLQDTTPSSMAASRFNPFPNKPWFLRVCSASLLKTLWEKEKLLVTSNFSFYHSFFFFYLFGELSAIFIKFKFVVCKLFKFGRVQNLSFGKGLIQYPTSAFGRILFSSVVMVLAFRPGVPAMHLLICVFVTDFVRKKGARLGLDFLPNKPFRHQ